jgi:Rad3-related DNA helicase
VIFDECHTIDEACIEAFSLNLNEAILEEANGCIKRLEQISARDPGLDGVQVQEGVLDDEIWAQPISFED